MKLNIRRISTIIVIVMLAIMCFSVSTMAENVGVPLVGLDWRGQPCTNILVPEELPQEFIVNTNDLMIDNMRFNTYLTLLSFISGDVILTALVTHDCPSFITLSLYNIKTESCKYWLYNVAGEFREVTEEEYSKFEESLTEEVVMSYCESEKI